MGKGDKKKKGKICIGSYGKIRLRKKSKVKFNLKPIKPQYSYKFVNSSGKEIDVIEAVFPILTAKGDEYQFVGTGFFINAFGGFITAKHVALDNYGKPINPFIVVQKLPEGKFVLRHVKRIDINPNADAAAGMLQTYKDINGKLISNPRFTMKKAKINIGDEIKTIAYPKSKIITIDAKTQIGEFAVTWERGKVVAEYPNGRDKTFLPGACFQTSVKILGGASGGPVINKEGLVVGINSTGYDLENDEENNISFITPISEVFDKEIRSSADMKVKIGSLIEHGSVRIK